MEDNINTLGDVLAISEIRKWEEKCLDKLNNTATLELHFSKKDLILATKEAKLSFVGALGNIGKYSSYSLKFYRLSTLFQEVWLVCSVE